MSGTSAGGGGKGPISTGNTFGNLRIPDTRTHAISSFLAGDEIVRIVPSFDYKATLGLISRSVGPFRAGIDAPVPLWLAVYLRRRNLARIIPPNWMDADRLREVLRFERDPDEPSFSPDLPFRQAEVARAMLTATGASSSSSSTGGGNAEIPRADEIKLLLEDIAIVRMDKIRRNVHTLSSQNLTREAPLSVIDVTGIGSLEVHAIRPFILQAFRDHRALSGKDKTLPTSSSDGGGSAANAASSAAAALRRKGGAAAVADPTAPPQAQAGGGRSRIRRFR